MSFFFTRRFYLDTPTDRSKNRGGAFFVGEFRSFWVSASNNTNFQCDLVINPGSSNDDRGIPLRLNQCQAFEDKPDGACVEFSTAQPGVWVDITFAQEDRISVGSVVVQQTGSVAINEGSNHVSAQVDVTNVPVVVFPADSGRIKGTIQNKGLGSIWIGNDSAAELQHANWRTICEEVPPGANCEWKNAGSLSARTDAGTVSISTRKEF